MNTSPLPFVLFDAVGTLIYPEPAVVVVYQAIGVKHGLELAAAELRARFRSSLQNANLRLRGERWNWQTDEPREVEYWRTVVRDVLAELTPAAAEAAFRALWQHFARAEHWRVFDDVAPTLAGLRDRGYRCGIASNFDERLRGICAAHPVLAQFEPLFVSSSVGWSKPVAGFYASIEQRTGLLPQQLLLVGDDWENDVTAPQSRGWQARWLDRSARGSTAESISTLTDLLDELPGE
jgi:putative hydrolase of the HAD superfamily